MMIQRATAFVLCWTLIAGCGSGAIDKSASKRLKTFPSSGSVKFNGQPVAGATVVFAPDPGGTPTSVAALAMTDASGNFTLQAYPPLKGAVPGKYKVAITKMESAPPRCHGSERPRRSAPTRPQVTDPREICRPIKVRAHRRDSRWWKERPAF